MTWTRESVSIISITTIHSKIGSRYGTMQAGLRSDLEIVSSITLHILTKFRGGDPEYLPQLILDKLQSRNNSVTTIFQDSRPKTHPPLRLEFLHAAWHNSVTLQLGSCYLPLPSNWTWSKDYINIEHWLTSSQAYCRCEASEAILCSEHQISSIQNTF